MLPPVGIEPRPLMASDSKSNTILSGLAWHVLFRRSLNFCWTYMIQLESIEHDYISLSLTSKCKVSPERRVLDLESEIMRGPGSIPLGVSFFTGFFFT